MELPFCKHFATEVSGNRKDEVDFWGHRDPGFILRGRGKE
jgi:hypothetical protein